MSFNIKTVLKEILTAIKSSCLEKLKLTGLTGISPVKLLLVNNFDLDYKKTKSYSSKIYIRNQFTRLLLITINAKYQILSNI